MLKPALILFAFPLLRFRFGLVLGLCASTVPTVLAAPLYPPPVAGWAYELTGGQAMSGAGAALDGTWNHDNGSDSWFGDGRGPGVGLVGGIGTASGILTLEDALTSGSTSSDNRRFYLTRDTARDGQVTDGVNLLDNGVTLYFRARLTPPAPTDPLSELGSAPDGFVNQGAGKGMIGIRQSGGSGMIISFSLNRASEDLSPTQTQTFAAAGLHMNNLNGNSRSPFVDPDGGGAVNLLPLDPTVFHDFWITIVANGAEPGTHRVSVYVDGASTPTVFNVTAGTGFDGPAANYLALGPGAASQVGAFDLDFLAYRQGAVAPASFEQPPAIVQAPQDQYVPAGEPAFFEVVASGAPPLTYRWYRDGLLVASGAEGAYQSAPVMQGDSGAQFWVVVSNAFGVVTSQPPARLTLLPPPQILVPPASQTVTNGDWMAITVEVASLVPPTYQWHNLSTGPVPGGTNSTLIFEMVTEGLVGPYVVIVSNAAGQVTSPIALLEVVSFDFGDAPDLVFAYGTRLINNGARHRITPGWHLGQLIDSELDGLPDTLALGDDGTGVDDEDGVLLPGPFVVGGSINVTVVASTNGFLQAWVDLNVNGTWTDPGEQLVVNRALSAGNNVIALSVPAEVTALVSYARFRFSSVPDLSPFGPAPDGEVEDYRVSFLHESDVRLSATSTPDVVAVGSNITFQATVTNVGPSRARTVYLTNDFSGPISFVSAQISSGGGCGVQGNRVICALNDILPSTAVNMTLVVRPSAAGSLTNRLTAFRSIGDPNFSNNSASRVTSVLDPPVFVVPPMSQAVTNGQLAAFSVTVTGQAPLAYQWFFNGSPVSGATTATLTIPVADLSKAGLYSVRVSNVVAVVTSPEAVLSVLLPPAIVVQPQNVTNLAGSLVTFMVTASGTTPMTYRWFYNGATLLPGPGQPHLTLNNVTLQQAGQYSVSVSNVAGVVHSSQVWLVLAEMDLGDAPAPYPTLLSQNGARHRLREGVYLGAGVDYDGDGQPHPAAEGDDLAGIDDEDGVTFGALRLGQVSSVEVLASTNGLLNGWIDFNGDGDWDDAGEQVFVDQALVTGVNHLNVAVPASATPGVTFGRFRFSTTGGLGPRGEAPDGEVEDYRLVIGATFDLNVLANSVGLIGRGSELTYSIVVSNKGPSLTADVVLEQTFSGAVAFLGDEGSLGCVQEGSIVRCFLGQLAALSSLAVQISVSPQALGALTNQLVVEGVGSENNPADNVARVVTTVLEPPTITVHPAAVTITNGQSATFTAAATGDALALRWRFNGVDVPGATGTTLLLNNVQLAADGFYTLFASNIVGTATSLPARLTVLAAPVIGTHPQSAAVFEGTNLTLSVSVTGSQPLTYQWEFNGGALPGAGAPTLQLAGISPSQAGSYRVRVSNPLGQALSQAAIVTVVSPPTITQQPLSQTVWAGLSAQLTAAAAGTAPLTYQWFVDGVVVAGATGPTLSLPNVQPAHAGGYSLVVTNAYGAVTSQVAQLTVWRVDFGDAPAPYPTRTNQNGAYHLIVPGVHLGNSVDGETDGQPNSTATGDDLSGVDDEDGVRVIGVLRAGQMASIEVVASTNGFLDAWIDFVASGLWVDSGDHIFQSRPVQPGTNLLSFSVPPTAVLGNTFARFRYSLLGGLSFTGPAPDGEVEDYQVAIAAPFDLALAAGPVPLEGSIGEPIIYSLQVSNQQSVTATQVSLVNTMGANVAFLSAVTSRGFCSQANGVVTCQIGTLTAGQAATITIQAVPTQGGWVTNRAQISAAEFDPISSNDRLIHATRVVQHVVHSNPTLINIAQLGPAQPYPSTIVVSGVSSVVDRISVTLSNLTHTFPDDIDILLVGPRGQGVILMSDAGGGGSLTDVTLIFEDNAILPLPDVGTIQSGTVRPGNFGELDDAFPMPAPQGRWESRLSVFSGTNPNGTWSLYVVDDEDEDTGRINDGWSLNIATLGPLANLSVTMTDLPDPITVGSNLTYGIVLTNRGPAVATGVVLTDQLPPGAAFVSADTSQGSCTLAAGVVTCQIGTLPPDQSVQVQIRIRPLGLGILTNTIAARADQFDNDMGDNNAVAVTQVLPAADLAVLPVVVPAETLLGGESMFSFIVTNRSTLPATGVALEDLFPSWAGVNGMTVSQGSCVAESGKVTCQLGVMAGLSSATFTLRLSPWITGMLVNELSVSAIEFDPNPANNVWESMTQVVLVREGGVSGQIVVPALGAATPYPSTLTLSGLTTAVSRVSVTLSNLTHSRPDDLDVLLVGPQGHAVMVLSDAGGSISVGNVTLTFDDQAAGVAPDGGPLVGGQYRPSVYDPASDLMPVPAPAGPYGSSLAALAGTDPNGTWSLYVADDLATASGVIGGWSLRVVTRDPLADLGVELVGPSGPVAVSSNVIYVATISNHGPATALDTVLQNPVNGSFAFVSADPSQGSCVVESGMVTCHLGTIPAQGSATVSLVMTPLQSGNVQNSVSVSGGVADLMPANNTAQVLSEARNPPMIIARPPDQVVTNGHSVAFSAVVSGDAPLTYQWFRNDLPLAGATDPVLVIPEATIEDNAAYLLQVSNSVGMTLSGGANLRVLQFPTISSLTGVTIAPNSSAGPIFFSVTDFESPTFALLVTAGSSNQELVPDQNIELMGDSFGLNRSLRVTPVPDRFGTAVISLFATDEDGLTATNSFLLSVATGVEILTQPQNQTTAAWGEAVFSVVAAGDGALTYQWRRNGVNLPGRTSSTLLLSNVQLSEAGLYTVLVRDSLSSALSAPAQLTVTARLSIVELIRGTPTRVRFTTEGGLTYTLYYKDRVDDSLWTALGSVAGTGAIGELADPNPGPLTRFYRVVGE